MIIRLVAEDDYEAPMHLNPTLLLTKTDKKKLKSLTFELIDFIGNSKPLQCKNYTWIDYITMKVETNQNNKIVTLTYKHNDCFTFRVHGIYPRSFKNIPDDIYYLTDCINVYKTIVAYNQLVGKEE